MGLFDDVFDAFNVALDVIGLAGESGNAGSQASSQAGNVLQLGLDIARIESRRQAAREQTRLLRDEAVAVARQGSELIDDEQQRARRLVSAQQARLGASGFNLINGGGSPGLVLADTLEQSLRNQRRLRERTDTATNRLLEQGRAVRRAANRARILGFVSAGFDFLE